MSLSPKRISQKEQEAYCKELSTQCFERVQGLDVNGKRIYDFEEHQQIGIESLAGNLHRGCKRTSIIHPGGSGKSVLEAGIVQASQAAKEVLGGKFSNTQDIVLSVERTIIGGIREHIESLGLDVGQWGSGAKQLDRSVVVATIQALQSSTNLAAEINLNSTTLAIGDEADVLSTAARSKLLDKFPIAQRVGLTATDKRNDGRLIQGPWGEIAHRVTLREGIESAIATPPLYYLFQASVEGDEIKLSKGDYDQRALEQAMKKIEIEKAIPEIYETLIPKDKRKDFPTLVYVPSIRILNDVTRALKRRYRGEGVIVSSWSNETSGKTINDEIFDFENGAIDILVLCEMGGRGLNLVRARCIIDGHPTLSLLKLEQRHSRAFRMIRKNSQLAASGFKKPFALVAQIIPSSSRKRAATLLDVLDAWDDYEVDQLLDFGVSSIKQSPAARKYTSEEVRGIVAHIQGSHTVLSHLHLLEKVDYLQKIRLRDDLPVINEDGYTIIDGKRYASIPKWAEVVGMTPITIRKKIDTALAKHAVDARGNDFDVYPEYHIREVFRREMESPKVDANGYIYVENKDTGEIEPHAIASTWASVYGISAPSITKKMKPVRSLYGADGRDQNNTFREKSFYPKSAVEMYCTGLIDSVKGVEDKKALPKIEKDGFARVDNERVGTTDRWKQEFRIVKKTIDDEVMEHRNKLEATRILGCNGRVYTGYKESEMRDLMNFILQYPRADDDNFLRLEGNDERYATETRWATELGLGLKIIQERLANHKGDAISGRDKTGKIHENAFYPESLVRTACADLLKILEELNDDVPEFDSEGFFMIGGEKYGAISAISKKIGIATITVESRLAKNKAIAIKRKRRRNSSSHSNFYSLNDARAACDDLLNGDYPEVDKNGFFEALNPHTGQAEKHATISRWKQEPDIPFTGNTLRKRLKKNGNLERGITGFGHNRRIEENGFYP
ncbi:DEAD/DEAH box helicase, partial [Patescibacteria group bacterium]